MKPELKRIGFILVIIVKFCINNSNAQDSTGNKICRYIGVKAIYEQNTSYSVAPGINNPIGYGIAVFLPVSKTETNFLETGIYFIRAATGTIFSNHTATTIYSDYLTIPADFKLDMGIFYLSTGFSIQCMLSQYYDHTNGTAELYNSSVITPMINLCPGLQFRIFQGLSLFAEYRFDMDPKGLYAPGNGIINDSRFAEGIGFGMKYKLNK